MEKKQLQKILKGLRRKDVEDLQLAVRRKDASYIRGMVQWYTRKPVAGNDELVPFLKKALSMCSTPDSSEQPSSDT